MIPGELFGASGEIEINASQLTVTRLGQPRREMVELEAECFGMRFAKGGYRVPLGQPRSASRRLGEPGGQLLP